MTSTTHLRWIFGTIISPCLRVCGTNVLDPDFRINRITCTYVLLACSGWYWVYFTMSLDREKCLKCLPAVGMLANGFTKIYLFTAKAADLRRLFEYLSRVYGRCESRPRFEAIVLAWILRFRLMVRYYGVLIVLCAANVLSNPLIQYCVSGQLEPILPVYFPHLTDGSRRSYAILGCLHLAIIVLVCFPLLATDFMLCMLALNTCPLSCVLQSHWRLLGERLRQGPQRRRRREVALYLHRIIAMHVEFDRYTRCVSQLFNVTLLGEVLSNSLAMCVLIFLMHQMLWLPLYTFFALFGTKLFATCAMGTVTEHYVEQLGDCIRQFDYHRLAVPEQRKFALVVQRALAGARLMAGTVVLNMETFVGCIKTVYSVAMLLGDVVE